VLQEVQQQGCTPAGVHQLKNVEVSQSRPLVLLAHHLQTATTLQTGTE
jgi:hypothetical protein